MAQIPKNHILEGPIVKTLFVLGWPIMVTNLLHTMYNLVDTFWLGKLVPPEGTFAVAALQISWPIIFLLISLAFGFGSAGVALVSQYTGAGDPKEANESAGQVLFISAVMGVCIGVVGFLFSSEIVELLGLKEEIAVLATTYLRIIFMGIPFMFISFIFGFILRAYGDTVTPMKVEGATVLLNVVLDPLLIFGLVGLPRLGVIGAGTATVLSQSVSSAIALYILFSGKAGIKLSVSCLKPVKWRITQILRIGIPASVGQSGTAFGFVILMYIIARLPNQEAVLAAYGIGDRIINLMFIAINGLGVGVATILGQSLGANNVSRAEEAAKKGMALMFSILVIGCCVLFPLRRLAIQVFINDPQVIAAGDTFIRVFLFGVPFFGVFSAVNACFMGSGHNVPSMVIELSRLWGLRIPLAYVFGFVVGWSASGVWFGMGLSNVLGAVIALALFKTGMWKEKVIKKNAAP
ncbi:MAG: MATE family efflux transporter [Theionarchaea archaeon]|nr:MATE family efflux transporter [Theionarchaea archaeon]MBU7037153.1 MATE family efflux transporter [Theionarchaea archaeon]